MEQLDFRFPFDKESQTILLLDVFLLVHFKIAFLFTGSSVLEIGCGKLLICMPA